MLFRSRHHRELRPEHRREIRWSTSRRKLTPILSELSSIRRDLEGLRVNVENVIGYRKEIDYALERIAALEKHLGIERKIAA